MPLPTSRNEFKERCLRDLGYPVIKINISDEQLEDKIDDALHFWRDYHHEAVERKYLAIQLTQTDVDNKYLTLPENVLGVTRILSTNTIGSSSTDVLSASYQLTSELVLQASRDSFSGGLTHFWITNQYLATVEDLFTRYPLQEFRRHVGRLYLHVDWALFHAGAWFVCEVLAYIPDSGNEGVAKIWSDRMLRKYAVALMKKQWGTNISKFAGVQLPGGITLDGPKILDEANAEIEKLESDFINRYSEPDQWYMG